MRYDLLLCRAGRFGMTPLAAASSEFESVNINNIDEVTNLLLKLSKKKKKNMDTSKALFRVRTDNGRTKIVIQQLWRNINECDKFLWWLSQRLKCLRFFNTLYYWVYYKNRFSSETALLLFLCEDYDNNIQMHSYQIKSIANHCIHLTGTKTD